MSEFIGVEASVLIRPDTSKFRAELIAQLKAATAGVSTSVPALAAATTATANLGAVQEKAATNARKESAEQTTLAKKVRDSARAHEQLTRGAGSSLLTLLGVRGATLAASGAFLAGAASITILSKSVQGAIDDQETLFRVTRVLGTELGEGSKKWSQTLANSFGIADDEALKFEGAIAETLHNVGIAPAANAALSQSFVELAADMAAFAHVPVEDTLRGLQLAISGNTRSLRQYGIVIQNSEVQQRALTETGKASTDQLTRQELALARISIIQERTSNQVGAFADNAGSLANQAKILSANLDALGDSIGSALLPPLVLLTQKAIDGAKALKFIFDKTKELAPATERADHSATAFGQALHFVGEGAKFAALASITGGGAVAALTYELIKGDDAARRAGASYDLTASSLQRAGGITQIVTTYLDGLATSFDRAAAKFRQGLHLQVTITTNRADTASRDLLALEAAGAGTGPRLEAANKEVAAAQRALDAALRLPAQGTSQTQKIVEARLQALKQARGDIAGVQGEIDSAASAAEAAAKAAAAAAERAAREAQAALDAQDQSLLTAQQIAQTDVQIAAVKAEHTKSLVDDLAVLRRQLALTEEQIIEARKIHDATLRRQTIQQLTLDAEQTRLSIQQTREQQLQNIRQRKVDAAEAAVQSAQLDAELADTLKKPKAQIAALQRENKALEEERKLWHGNVLKLKEIRNQIAANNAEIKKIRGETDNRADELARLEFTFLQTQSGFAGTLLSNLIPHDVAAGTVGGAAINTSTGAFDSIGPAGFATAAHRRPGQDLSDATQTKASARGASMSQMATLITINRHMLQAILRLSSQRAHPEATYQSYTGAQDLNVATST